VASWGRIDSSCPAGGHRGVGTGAAHTHVGDPELDGEEETMRIAVAACGRELTSQVDGRLGRAPWFLIVDTKTGEIEAIENEGAGAVSGSGPKAAEMMATHSVDCLIAGHCGPNAFAALAAYGIDVVTGATSSVHDAIEDVKAGRLKAARRPDVKGHWS
jgi:predicted Fe-Mo cluster-binding NifX family protein